MTQLDPTTSQPTVLGDDIACPWCGSENHHVASPFGGSISEVLMKCEDCEASFGWMKWRAKAHTPNN